MCFQRTRECMCCKGPHLDKSALEVCHRPRAVFTVKSGYMGENGRSYYERPRGRDTFIFSGFINLPIDNTPKKFQVHSLMHSGRMLDSVPPRTVLLPYVPIVFKIWKFFCDWAVRSLWIGRRLASQAIKNEQIIEK